MRKALPPRMNPAHRKWMGWLLAAVAVWTVFGLALAPPFAGEGWRQAIMLGFSSACHQIPARSPHVHDVALAVCDRCFGVYAALAVAPFLTLGLQPWNGWMQRHAKYLLLGALLVPAVDWGGGVVGWWVNTPWSRMATGAAFGAMAGYFLVCAAMSLPGRSPAEDADPSDTPIKTATSGASRPNRRDLRT